MYRHGLLVFLVFAWMIPCYMLHVLDVHVVLFGLHAFAIPSTVVAAQRPSSFTATATTRTEPATTGQRRWERSHKELTSIAHFIDRANLTVYGQHKHLSRAPRGPGRTCWTVSLHPPTFHACSRVIFRSAMLGYCARGQRCGRGRGNGRGPYLPEVVDFVQLSYLCKPRTRRLLAAQIVSFVECEKGKRAEGRTTNRFRASNPRFQAVSHSNSVPGTNS